ncbi:MAG: hypothetical protein LBG72_06205 [Spirochaetaceae bacterium]|nr:hypothetical protein [Spirochaetaceae bacterium]
MNYDNFSAARDIFYLAAALAGSAAGTFAGAYSPAKTLRERAFAITASLFILTAGIAAGAAALCINESIVYQQWMYILSGIFAIVFFLAFFFNGMRARFLAAAVLSVIVLSAVYFYQIGNAFNGESVPVAHLIRENGDIIRIKPSYNKIAVFKTEKQNGDGTAFFYDKRYTNTLKYTLCYIQAGRAAPVFGGARRVILLSITAEQTEPGRSTEVFWTKPMEETFLGRLLGAHTELVNSISEKVFIPPGRGVIEMQIIYGKAKIPAMDEGAAPGARAGAVDEIILALQNEEGIWRENWLRALP